MASIDLNAENVSVDPRGYNSIDVSLVGVDIDQVLDSINIKDAVSYYGDDDLLDMIGEEAARQYFNIEDKE